MIMKANIIEKVYWITAFDWQMDHNLFNFSSSEKQESIITTMLTPIDATREDIQLSLEARASALGQGAEEHPRPVVIFREVRNMSDLVADEFSER